MYSYYFEKLEVQFMLMTLPAIALLFINPCYIISHNFIQVVYFGLGDFQNLALAFEVAKSHPFLFIIENKIK